MSRKTGDAFLFCWIRDWFKDEENADRVAMKVGILAARAA